MAFWLISPTRELCGLGDIQLFFVSWFQVSEGRGAPAPSLLLSQLCQPDVIYADLE